MNVARRPPESACVAGVGEEAFDGRGVDVVERGAAFDDGIPGEAAFVEKEFVEGGSLDFLCNGAVALVVAAAK